MARTGRIKREGAANYHLMSRTNGKRFLFEKSEVKTALVDLLKRRVYLRHHPLLLGERRNGDVKSF